MKLRLAGTIVLTLGVVALASTPAFAGNGNGNGNDKSDPAAAPAADVGAQEHGNSGNAPGQLKKEEAPSTAGVPEQSAAATAPGVKPSSDTEHETRAPASSGQTKFYGNGKTAGQIAQQNGAPPSTILHGPGNSQPHKAAPCAGGHEVDVHALKAKRRSICGGGPPTPHSTPDPGKTPDPVRGLDRTPSQSGAGVSRGSAVVVGAPNAPTARPHSQQDENAAVLAATGVTGRRATLPFTGFDLGGAAFLGVGLMLIGGALCRRARTLPAPRKSEEELSP